MATQPTEAVNLSKKIILGALLDCTADPAKLGEKAVRFEQDGAMVIENGKIIARGTREQIENTFSVVTDIEDYSGKFIIPGMIDTHVHYPQTEMIAAYGEQLLTWLIEHAFPTEKKFADKAYAKSVAEVFLTELVRNGTTTALVFGTVHSESVDAFFEVAQQKQLRMIAGKVMMDRNCPDDLQDTPETGYADSKALIEKWHGKDRLQYAVTPRFAPTSSPEQLKQCAALLKEYPSVYMHTHTSENVNECQWVKELYPDSLDYVGVYEDFELLRKRSVLAHGIHLNERELNCLHKTETSVAHCPTSNLFIGSGLFNIQQFRDKNIAVGMGTDVGAGTSFSMLQTFSEAYKVQQLQKNNLTAFEGLFLNTLGGARALDLEGTIGQLEVNCEADFVVLDDAATPFLRFRMQAAKNLHEKLFTLMMLGDDRTIYKTFANGRAIHTRDQ